MRVRTVLKWLLLALPVLAGAGLAFAWSRDQFPGHPVNGTVIALVGGDVYDPVADSLLQPATVVIRGREIVAVGPDVRVPSGARTYYVSGLTLLPGFIDSHVHLSGIGVRPRDGAREFGALGYFWRYMRRFPERRRALIAAGVTSVKSLGDPYPWILKLAERVEQHELAGPRIFAAGPTITSPGGHPIPRLRRAGQGDTSFIAQVTRQVASAADAELAVETFAAAVDYISLAAETPGGAALPVLSSRAMAAAVQAAHRHERKVLAHVATLDQLKRTLAVGVDGIEHLPRDELIADGTLEAMRRHAVFVVPTLQAAEQHLGVMLRDPTSARRARANARRLAVAGVPLLAGSDAPAPGTAFGFTLHEELRNLVEAGYTPGQAIAAATSAAAEHLGLSDRLGTIAPGKLADIVAVIGEPLEDIAWASQVYLVVADGQVLLDRLHEVQRRGGVLAARGPDPATRRRGAPRAGRPGHDAHLSRRSVRSGRDPRRHPGPDPQLVSPHHGDTSWLGPAGRGVAVDHGQTAQGTAAGLRRIARPASGHDGHLPGAQRGSPGAADPPVPRHA